MLDSTTGSLVLTVTGSGSKGGTGMGAGDRCADVTNSSLKRPSYHSGARSFLLGTSPTLALVFVLFADWSKTRFQEVPQPLHCLPCMEGDSHDSPM